ncbi:unnamed protein product [Pleuronectes platessa]|uniref:Uncharacterized protein n=1 Tax=Pleuronectes platessa TaxID=8262 RepID=A0A9N7YNS0_PLEPL|nr:unnamed protein product [Pleuronectes platessa]
MCHVWKADTAVSGGGGEEQKKRRREKGESLWRRRKGGGGDKGSKLVRGRYCVSSWRRGRAWDKAVASPSAQVGFPFIPESSRRCEIEAGLCGSTQSHMCSPSQRLNGRDPLSFTSPSSSPNP